MTEPRVPGTEDDDWVDLPCGEQAHVKDFDLGMREYECSCGGTHAVVMDMHPPSRFVPESIVAVLKEAVTPAPDDEFEEFGTPHLMGSVMEQLPEDVVAVDGSENGSVGYALLWVTDMDARELHEVVVELVVELMDHAVSHADGDDTAAEFEQQMQEFDVSTFVDRYRDAREFEDEYDTPA
ncbi:DUF5815 family protein [Halobacterium bonnevillei]|uniref:Uncharacterized protein n=1 Tax=Halobacterium bonnevillei TaxID=2692200 RepID=A0A6B0SML4_9EURY|nr:DUF5815 family protein [Halobacterium bonnevillei]MXR20931.1 hypothetical protein [Halobacterium bonnevillei]